MTVIRESDLITWWDKFLNKNRDKKVFRKIFEKIEVVDNKTTEESLKELQEMIDELDSIEYQEEIENFNRKTRIFEKRLERQISKDLGSMLKYLRESKGLSLSKLEELTGISASYINRIELGQRKTPSYPVIEKIAEALDISIYSLLNVASKEEETKALSIAEIIYSNEVFLVKEEDPINLVTKEQLINIIEFIVNMEWKDNKHTEILELIDIIDEFK